MSNNGYLKIVGAKFVFLTKYFRILRFLIIIVYLFYLAVLTIDVFFAAEYVPSLDEVKIKFSPIKAKNEIINSIESYFSDRQDNLEKNLLKSQEYNPFLPYGNEPVNSANNLDNFEIKPIN